MPVRTVDLGVLGVDPSSQDGDDLLLLVRRVEDVGADTDDQGGDPDSGERFSKPAPPPSQVEEVERPGEVEVGVGVEAIDELFPLVVQVTLDLELGGERVDLDRGRRSSVPGQTCATSTRRSGT